MERSKKTERGWQGRETSGLFLSISPLGCLQDTLAAVPLPLASLLLQRLALRALQNDCTSRGAAGGGGNGEIWLEILLDLGD